MDQIMPDSRSIMRVRSLAVPIRRTLVLVWKVAPFWTSASVVLVVVQGLLPLAALYLMKKVVDTVEAGVRGNQAMEESMERLVLFIALAGCVALAVAFCRMLGEIVREGQSFYVNEAMTDRIHRHSIALDLAHYEDPTARDMMHRAQQEAPYRPLAIITSLTQMAQAAVSLLGIAGLLLTYNVWLTLILLFCVLPGALMRLFFTRRMRDIQRRQTQQERLTEYYHHYLIAEAPAKEVKMLRLGDLFRERYRALRRRLRAGKLGVTRRREYADFLGQAIAAVALFASLGYVALSALRGAISLGAMVMYYQAFQTGLSQLQVFLRGAANLLEHGLFLENYYQFLDLKPGVVPREPRRTVPARFAHGIRFHDVCFRYPNRAEYALRGINLEIRPGQVIALVGPNGSGKTTIAKLIPRLYDPTEGVITLDGVDLRNMDPEEWRRQVSVVFQDFLRYPLSARENIWLGDIGQDAASNRVEKASRESGAAEMIQRLARGYDTILGNEYTGGHQLSGGEWQKIAVARAFFREANLAILDEPSSALDPQAEADVFARFRQLIAGRSAVLISHRFSTVQMADYIYVLDEGHIMEEGTHQDLLRAGGAYAQLFYLQAEKFLRAAGE